ncbi:MAG: pyridoxal-phosphate dependent enzyme [Thaumarchaeota archaeon]|jgi:cysteine synthase|nr:pyridoxal-phosphate dependent enzyme [Candidatus Geocrenenecus arthurdayi]MCL7390980.1 pyridoxal-phosphate dependent enzyme [Candidatus Geocrenenecus arthurdayi]MCL7396167.1 pyridoxal-phosphate dependent enzyme [Candidatus Geocrenenecus arthurdayi]MCL7401270.1 pyridoxal-phosphate dependent enzyme [Candidatus Geocrenenecus arthurdayi]MCL7403204.1 pyridoxal-phosphate dependent enzyme [Candidatus Geocrenenecus arthurdayi]
MGSRLLIENILECLRKDYLKPTGSRIIDLDDFSIIVKLEYPIDFLNDPLRTIKRKPATLLFEDTYNKGWIKPGRTIITASSGNFLRELALIALNHGFKVIGVTPPRIPSENLKILTALGVDILHITEEYDLCPRETTVFYTRSLAEKYRFNLVNIDQYNSWQNVMAHLYLTWEEIKELGEIDYACIPLGSTGTFIGISTGCSLEKWKMKIIGVQPTRFHHIPGVHHIVGECEWSPEIFSSLISREIVTIDDVDAYAGLVMLWKNGIPAGPSTGMTFIQAVKLAKQVKEGSILTISADSIFAYRDYVLDYMKEIIDQIITRYPEIEEDCLRYIEWLRKLPSIDERLELVKRIYRTSGVAGRVFKYDNEEELLKQIQVST